MMLKLATTLALALAALSLQGCDGTSISTPSDNTLLDDTYAVKSVSDLDTETIDELKQSVVNQLLGGFTGSGNARVASSVMSQVNLSDPSVLREDDSLRVVFDMSLSQNTKVGEDVDVHKYLVTTTDLEGNLLSSRVATMAFVNSTPTDLEGLESELWHPGSYQHVKWSRANEKDVSDSNGYELNTEKFTSNSSARASGGSYCLVYWEMENGVIVYEEELYCWDCDTAVACGGGGGDGGDDSGYDTFAWSINANLSFGRQLQNIVFTGGGTVIDGPQEGYGNYVIGVDAFTGVTRLQGDWVPDINADVSVEAEVRADNNLVWSDSKEEGGFIVPHQASANVTTAYGYQHDLQSYSNHVATSLHEAEVGLPGFRTPQYDYIQKQMTFFPW